VSAAERPAPRAGGVEIHPTALVDPAAELGRGVRIDAYSLVRARARIGDGTWIGPHVVIEEDTILGADCRVSFGAALGGPPQDRHYTGEHSRVRIGDRVVLREYVSLSRATGDGEETVVGDETEIFAYSHAGHNCRIGRNVIITNACQLAGHVVIEDRAVLGGMVGIIQRTHVGALAMIAGFARVVQDVLPYMMVTGNPARTVATNRVGLERAGVPREVREDLRRAHRLLVRSGLDTTHALARIEAELAPSAEIAHLVEFLHASRARGAGFVR
jgi:UDP-N-acetylglucosamine acyltransferase